MIDSGEKMCYFQGKLCKVKDANVNIQTHSFNYGTGVFGGVRGYYNADKKNIFIFRLYEHWERLILSSKIMQMKWKMSYDQFGEIVLQVIREGKWEQNIYLRPIIYKNSYDLSPHLHSIDDDFALYVIPLNDYLDTQKGLSACVSSWRRISDNQIPTRSKAIGGYINSALAKSEALENGFDEAIFLDNHENVSEGSAENIFLVRNGELITPEVSDSILEGVTRRTILQLAKDIGIPYRERRISRSEMYLADEIFFAGTGVQVAWVRSVDRREIGNGQKGEITNTLNQLFLNIVHGKENKYSKWLTPVY